MESAAPARRGAAAESRADRWPADRRARERRGEPLGRRRRYRRRLGGPAAGTGCGHRPRPPRRRPCPVARDDDRGPGQWRAAPGRHRDHRRRGRAPPAPWVVCRAGTAHAARRGRDVRRAAARRGGARTRCRSRGCAHALGADRHPRRCHSGRGGRGRRRDHRGDGALHWLDPALALLVGGLVVVAALHLLRDGLRQLRGERVDFDLD